MTTYRIGASGGRDVDYAKVRFGDLDTRGFVVIPSFLSRREAEFLLEDFRRQDPVPNRNYTMFRASEDALKHVKGRLGVVVSTAAQGTRIKIDLSGIRSGRYFDSQQTSFGWHQDHESYYEIQNHHDLTLNFFIPILKPLRNKGNISIIPWDVLARTSPQASAALVGHGGTTFKALGRKTLATDDRGIVSLLPYDVGDISETPELDVGDLLLLRGDVIHRTQDTETNRVAFSIRLVNPETRLQRRVLLDGGIRKTRMMARNWEEFGPLVRAFIASGKDTLTWREVQEAVAAFQGRPTPANQAAVYLFLLKQKLCVGVLGSSVGSALRGIGARLYQRAMRWRGDQSQASGRLS